MSEEQKIEDSIEVEFEEANLSEEELEREKEIRGRTIQGKQKYFTTGQVAKELGENDSTVRSWCDEFDAFLELKKVGKHRRFTEYDIERLKYIQTLIRENRLSHSQVKEHLSTPEAEMLISFDEKQHKDKLLKALVSLATKDMQEQLQAQLLEIRKDMELSIQKETLKIAEELKEQQVAIKSELKDEVAATMEKELISVNSDISDLRSKLEERHKEVEQSIHDLKIRLDERAKIALEERNRRGFWSRLFGGSN